MKSEYLFGGVLMLLLLSACRKDMQVLPEHDTTPYHIEHADFPEPEDDPENPTTVQGIKLGRMLFYETKLSSDNSMSCSSCHVQENAFSDTNRFSIGVEGLPGKRQAMAVFNMAWNTNEFFWDGRAHLLRDQATKPIQDALEMNETMPNVISKLRLDPQYPDQFIRAFGDDEITEERIAKALEQFMKSIVSVDSKYDRWKKGEVTFTASEERGRDLFFREYNPFFPDSSGADCQHCHGGANFENDEYLNNGLDTDADFTDLGREEVTGDPGDRAKFKVPSLRNIALTPPYMHDGRFQTLEEVVEHYDNGIHPSSTLDITLENTRATGLQLTQEDKEALVDFLHTLTDYDLPNNPEYSNPFE